MIDFILQYNDAVTGLLCVALFVLPPYLLTKKTTK